MQGETPTLFGASGKPITDASKAEAQVQPGPQATRSGPKNRYRGYYLMIPNKVNGDLMQAHHILAATERAPVDFGEFLLLLIMQGAQVYVTHQMTELEAESLANREGNKLAAMKLINDPEASEESKKAAHEFLAACAMEEAEAAGVKEAPKEPVTDERAAAPGDGYIPTEDTVAARADEAKGRDLIAEALASTPESSEAAAAAAAEAPAQS